jgi:guanylate kinase
MEENRKKGKVLVVSAPSGAGKTTLCKSIIKEFPEIAYSISHTTRTPRKNELNGQDYFFISAPEFEKKIEQDFWVEWAKVHGNYYGTSKEYLKEQISKGFNTLLEIDTNGAKQIKNIDSDAVTIFIMPPSFEILEKRLKCRGTDSESIINMRLDNAKAEMDQKDFYDYIVINDQLDAACEQICEIVKGNL